MVARRASQNLVIIGQTRGSEEISFGIQTKAPWCDTLFLLASLSDPPRIKGSGSLHSLPLIACFPIKRVPSLTSRILFRSTKFLGIPVNAHSSKSSFAPSRMMNSKGGRNCFGGGIFRPGTYHLLIPPFKLVELSISLMQGPQVRGLIITTCPAGI